jgi:hypothetical protein
LILSAIAQAQFRPVVDEKKEGEGGESTSVASSVAQLNKLHHTNETIFAKLPVDRKNMYGHCPRFIRMKLMHELIFYLTWDYSGESDTVQNFLFSSFPPKLKFACRIKTWLGSSWARGIT